MTTAASSAESDDREGRRQRGRILAAIAGVVLVGGAAGNFVLDRRSDERMDRLRADLESSFVGTTSAEFVPLYEAYVVNPAAEPSFLGALATNEGVTPDQAKVDGDVVQARYGFDSIGGGYRCVRLTLTPTGPAFAEGSGGQCTAFSLE